jgi:hypothetical protein
MSVAKRRLIVALAAVLVVSVIPVTVLAAGGTFIDDETSVFEGDIEWLASSGVTKGCNPPTNNRFCPDENVTRGQMAAFMRRFAQYLGAEDGIVSNADNADTLDGYSHGAFWRKTEQVNAATLDGLDSTDLVAAYGAASDDWIDDFATFPFTSILSDTVEAPIAGLLHITASVSGEDDCSLAGAGWLQVDIAVDGQDVFSDDFAFEVEFGDCGINEPPFAQAVAVNAVVEVAAGTHTVEVLAQEQGTGTFIIGRSITTLFVPFGEGVAIPVETLSSAGEHPNHP